MVRVMARGLLGPFPVAVHLESYMFTVKGVRTSSRANSDRVTPLQLQETELWNE